jgi:hypothetical protein
MINSPKFDSRPNSSENSSEEFLSICSSSPEHRHDQLGVSFVAVLPVRRLDLCFLVKNRDDQQQHEIEELDWMVS